MENLNIDTLGLLRAHDGELKELLLADLQVVRQKRLPAIQRYLAYASVIYKDAEGRRIDTFVIFDTDPNTGLTHINHENLKVVREQLELHPKTVGAYHLPLADAFSFELLRKLRDKYEELDKEPKRRAEKATNAEHYVLAIASW